MFWIVSSGPGNKLPALLVRAPDDKVAYEIGAAWLKEHFIWPVDLVTVQELKDDGETGVVAEFGS